MAQLKRSNAIKRRNNVEKDIQLSDYAYDCQLKNSFQVREVPGRRAIIATRPEVVHSLHCNIELAHSTPEILKENRQNMASYMSLHDNSDVFQKGNTAASFSHNTMLTKYDQVIRNTRISKEELILYIEQSLK
jgi:hypothetical protein